MLHRELLDLTTPNHNLQNLYCHHFLTYTDKLLLLDLSVNSMGLSSCELACVTACVNPPSCINRLGLAT